MLYELFGGALPQRGSAAGPPAGWSPILSDESLPGVPGPVVAVLGRLLEADPARRYQTARGAAADLQRCRAQWRRSGRLTHFALGRRDDSRRLRFSVALHGREQTLARLHAIFRRVVNEARPGLACLAGEPGVGKSALLAEFSARVARSGGRVLVARFDASARHVPYARLASALTQLASQLQEESAERLAAWRTRLAARVGPGADLLVELAPALAPVLGDPCTAEHLSATQAHRRLCSAVRRLITEVSADGPLVIVLDDLHQAHEMSLKLLAGMLTGMDSGPVLLVAAYQPRAAKNLGLTTTLSALGGRGTTVVLRPLPDTAVRGLLAEMLQTTAPSVTPLTQVIGAATRSNPLAIIQLMQELHDRRALLFEPHIAAWTCDFEAVFGSARPGDLRRLISLRIAALPAPLSRLLGVAALLGEQFDAQVLAAAVGKPVERVQRSLRRTLGRQLLRREGGATTYRWIHEQVRQAALRLLRKEQVPVLRLAVGRAMLANPQERAYPFDVVEHLNAGRHLIVERAERVQLASLNLTAGRIAKRRGAAVPARRYFHAGLAALPTDGWSRCNDLAVALHVAAAEAEHLAGEQDNARRLLDTAMTHAEVDLSQVDVLALHANLPKLSGDWDADAEPALRALRLLGVNAPDDPAEWRPAAAAALRALRDHLAETDLHALTTIPAMTDRRALAAANLIATLLPSAQARDPAWFTLLAAKGVALTLENGCAPASTVTFAFATLVLADHDHLDQAALCMDTTLRLMDRVPASPYGVHAKAALAHALPAWYRSSEFATGLLHQAYQDAIEHGELKQVRVNLILHHMYLFAAGTALDIVAEQVGAAWRLLAEHGGDDLKAAMGNRIMDRLVSRLRNTKPEPVPETATEAQLAALCRKGELGYASSVFLTRMLAAAYILGDHAEALELVETAQRIEPAGPGRFNVADRTFFHALTLTALYHTASPAQQRAWSITLDELQAALGDWATAGPRVFGWQALLVAAERARLAGHVDQAVGRYTRAIGTAREHGTVHGEAIAAELGGRYALARGQADVAAAYLRRARICYQQWGADAKVNHIDELLSTLATPATIHLHDTLDLFTILDAIQAIHSELEIDSLLTTILDAAIHHVGAQYGALTLPSLDPSTSVTVLRQTATGPTTAAEKTPKALMLHIGNSRSTAVGSYQEAFALAADPYLAQHQPASLLCAPILHRDELVAVLYLEHRHTSDLFTPPTRQLLHTLCVHAGIAIRNANRFAHLNDLTTATT
ncbi:AAA family ATPase [Micromonospora sp. ATCC 39149]|uniref:AAA family ATPase n=1 Tax=Micromonospora carbonacea TaxID=47853 RepID=A0A7D5YKY0_9ACTN|nr:AAA family ATPase [Micromonospora sp. ATCC 39149]QLK00475.1 AAA family ATPase [Micromonospora carbonacea]